MKLNEIFWYLMYRLFKIRRSCPKELLDFDEIYLERE